MHLLDNEKITEGTLLELFICERILITVTNSVRLYGNERATEKSHVEVLICQMISMEI
jgi:hypothetical protein